ncbi:TolB family protein [Frateuria sp. GZRe12]|uniref:TolB family protein n=1 Tax=Frateuria sp. GZRe12 TaxID=3351533 RepID=UPI003EDC6D44
MKTNKLAGSICALLLTALSASAAFAQSSTASILFTRTINRAIDGAHGTQLYRVKPSGQDLAVLVPVTYGADIYGASWSPAGSSVVYEVEAGAQTSPYYGSQLYVANRQGSSPRKLTTGDRPHTKPLWGPNGIIAFVSGNCLGTVHGDGTQEHIVFCPPRESGQGRSYPLNLFRWTPSGNGVLIEASGDEGGLEPITWFSTVYRVNVSTGYAVKLAAHVFDNSYERDLTIAPDNQHGVYSGNPLQVLDFATNTLTPLPSSGFDPLYSPDGRKVAFLKTETNHSPYYTNVYVVHPDGSHLRVLTNASPDVLTYTAIADWSWDSTRLLVDQVGDDRWLQIIDLRNNTRRNVTNGTADKHAWFHP